MNTAPQRPEAAQNVTPPAAIPSELTEEFRAVCRDAWARGLLSGCNGNASRKLAGEAAGLACVTRSGASKGRLTAQDCCLLRLDDGHAVLGGPVSSESGMHLAVYRARPDCRAILHTHPPRLLALSLRLGLKDENFLRLPLFEADVWRAKLGFAPALPPGTQALAEAVALAAADKDAVWMAGHGLCCLGQTLAEALSLTEELEHLAAVQLLSMP